MGLFDRYRDKKRREKSGEKLNIFQKMFKRKKYGKKKLNEPGTMGKPKLNMWGEPINPNYPKKTKQTLLR